MAVTVISLLNTINTIAEREQHSEREPLVPIYEAHIVTANPLLVPYAPRSSRCSVSSVPSYGCLPKTCRTFQIQQKDAQYGGMVGVSCHTTVRGGAG